jgi:hypothetical protein
MAAAESRLLPKYEQTAIFDEVMDHIISAFVINSNEKNAILEATGMLPKEFQYCCDPNVRATIQHLTQQLLEHDCIHKLFDIEGIGDILSYRNLYISFIVYYYAVGEIAGYHKFDLNQILENIVVGEDAEHTRSIIKDFIHIVSSADKNDLESFDPVCFKLLLHVRSELMKTKELSEEELRQWESGTDFVMEKGMSKTRQDEIAQGWIARGRRRAFGGKKSKRRKKKRKTIKLKPYV